MSKWERIFPFNLHLLTCGAVLLRKFSAKEVDKLIFSHNARSHVFVLTKALQEVSILLLRHKAIKPLKLAESREIEEKFCREKNVIL